MKADIKKKWVKALRSGKYKQGKGRLVDEKGGFCCLGVLTDLYIKEDPKTRSWEQGMNGLKYADEAMVTPKVVMEWAGLDDSNPCVVRNRLGDSNLLSEMNDGDGTGIKRSSGFRRIAAVIEKEL